MKRYICDKDNNEKIRGYLDFEQIDGFKIKPRNQVKYEGIEVSKMTLVEPSLIEMVLKKKTKRKLNAYLQFLISSFDDDTSSGDLSLILDDTKRYKAIIVNKYAKFLDAKYIKELLLRVRFIEDEIKRRLHEQHREYKASRGKGR